MPNDDHQRYSKVMNCYYEPADFEGRTIKAFHSDYSYAALLLDHDQVIAFAAEETSVGKWFEVFPLCRYSLPAEYPVEWTELDVPLTISRSEVMWRGEWLEPAREISGLLGSGPHSVQCVSTLGAAPTSSSNVVKVLAGIRLTGHDERALMICSSDNAPPFKVDFTTALDEMHRIIESHTCV